MQIIFERPAALPFCSPYPPGRFAGPFYETRLKAMHKHFAKQIGRVRACLARPLVQDRNDDDSYRESDTVRNLFSMLPPDLFEHALNKFFDGVCVVCDALKRKQDAYDIHNDPKSWQFAFAPYGPSICPRCYPLVNSARHHLSPVPTEKRINDLFPDSQTTRERAVALINKIREQANNRLRTKNAKKNSRKDHRALYKLLRLGQVRGAFVSKRTPPTKKLRTKR